jgi:hypothetical protein
MRPIVRPTMHLSISLSPPSAYAVRDPASGIWHLPSDPTAPTRLSRVTHETRILSFLLPLYFFFQKTKIWPFFLSFEASGVSTTTRTIRIGYERFPISTAELQFVVCSLIHYILYFFSPWTSNDGLASVTKTTRSSMNIWAPKTSLNSVYVHWIYILVVE